MLADVIHILLFTALAMLLAVTLLQPFSLHRYFESTLLTSTSIGLNPSLNVTATAQNHSEQDNRSNFTDSHLGESHFIDDHYIGENKNGSSDYVSNNSSVE